MLDRLTAEDAGASLRQVAVIGARGQLAVHTGALCIAEASHRTGSGYSCQANMMREDTVPDAMAHAYEGARGRSLAERLLAALDAGDAAGGDLRGRQSAMLLVVGPDGDSWRRLFDLRVDDHSKPLAELRRLQRLERAYNLSGEGEELVAEGRHEEAAPLVEQAAGLAPEVEELRFWAGLAAADGGDLDRAAELVRSAAAVNPAWLELLVRLPTEVAPSAAALRIELEMEEGSD